MHVFTPSTISNKMMGMRNNNQETYAFLANQSATSALDAANLASHSAVRVIVSLVDVLDEKVRFTPAEFTNSGFKARTGGMLLVGMPVSEDARVHSIVLKYLVVYVGQDQISIQNMNLLLIFIFQD